MQNKCPGSRILGLNFWVPGDTYELGPGSRIYGLTYRVPVPGSHSTDMPIQFTTHYFDFELKKNCAGTVVDQTILQR